MPGQPPTKRLPSHATSKTEGLPWGLVAPLGTPVELDPTQLATAQPAAAYLVEENDLHVTVYFEPQEGKTRFYLAEQDDAVWVVVATERLPADLPDRGWGSGAAHGMLSAPLAGRPIIDGTSGFTLRRLDARPTTWPIPMALSSPDPVSGIALPLFVSTGFGALMMFRSEEAVGAALPREFPVLVPDYEAFDRRGLRLELVPARASGIGAEAPDDGTQLTVRAAEREPTQQTRLRDLLRKTFGHPRKHPYGDSPAALKDLIDDVEWIGECFRKPPSVLRLRAEQFAKRLRGS